MHKQPDNARFLPLMTRNQVRVASLVVSAVVALAACSSSSSADGDPTTSVVSSPTTVSSTVSPSTTSSTTSSSTTSADELDDSSGTGDGSSVEGDATDDAEQTNETTSGPDGDAEGSSIAIILSASGLDPLGDEGRYLLVSYEGDVWRSGGSFDFDVSTGQLLLEEGTAELVIYPEFSNVAVLVGVNPGDTDQLAEKYFVADGSIRTGKTIDLVDASGQGLIVVSLGLPT